MPASCAVWRSRFPSRKRSKRITAIAISAFLYSCLALSFNYEKVWVHAGSAQRVSYEMFVMLALVCGLVWLAIRIWRSRRHVLQAERS